MAVFIWLYVSMCHTTHNNQRTMQVSLSAAWNSAGIVFVPFHILLGKALKLTQPPKCCNIAKQFSFTHGQPISCAFVSCHLDFRSTGSVRCSSENLSSLYFSSFSFLFCNLFFFSPWKLVLQRIINFVDLKPVPNQTYFSSCCANTTSNCLSDWQESKGWGRCFKQKLSQINTQCLKQGIGEEFQNVSPLN